MRLRQRKLMLVITFEKGFLTASKRTNQIHITITSIKGAEVTSFIKSYLYQYIDNVSALNLPTRGNDVRV